MLSTSVSKSVGNSKAFLSSWPQGTFKVTSLKGNCRHFLSCIYYHNNTAIQTTSNFKGLRQQPFIVLTGSLVSWVLMLTWAGLTALSWPHAGVCGQMMGFLGLTGLDQICWDYPTHPPINKPRLLVMIVAGVQKKKWRWAISFPYFCYVEFAISSLT